MVRWRWVVEGRVREDRFGANELAWEHLSQRDHEYIYWTGSAMPVALEQQRAIEMLVLVFDVAAASIAAGVAVIPERVVPFIFGAEAYRRISVQMLTFVRITAGMCALGALITAIKDGVAIVHWH